VQHQLHAVQRHRAIGGHDVDSRDGKCQGTSTVDDRVRHSCARRQLLDRALRRPRARSRQTWCPALATLDVVSGFSRTIRMVMSALMNTIDSLLDAFESRRLSRRELVVSLTTLIAGAAVTPAGAQGSAPISQAAQGRTLNHASLAVG